MMKVSNGEGIEELLKKVLSIDYKNSPAEAFLELNTCANTLKQKIRPYREIQAAEREIESVNWCICEILGFKNQTFDSYHECNFYAHQKRIIEAGKQIITGMEVLNEKTL
ncbi:MAG: hypothetical protein IT236_09390 [Bacteroidia bacterium]|nr:hypothetical protein [Bacteroidia bacterium]